MENIKPLKFNAEKAIKADKEITEIKYIGEPTNGEMVFSVHYTDKNFLPNDKYFFYYPTNPARDIEFTDETEFPNNLKQRIQYQVHKYINERIDREYDTNKN